MGLERSEIEPLIGKESGAIKALDDVSTSNVRRWYEILNAPDTEWIEKLRKVPEKPFPYMAEAKERILAEQARVRERPVPVPMMMTWARQAYWTPEPKEPSEPHELALKALDDAGYALTIGVNLEDELVKPVNVGDWLSYQVKLEGISAEEEETKLGKGYLVEMLYTFSNKQGEVVSRHKYTVLKTKRLSPVS
jgi:hypothetical protein